MADERRKGSRVNISFPIGCTTLTSHKYFYTVCKDISSSGLRIITDNFLPQGNSIKVNLDLISQVVSVKAKVMWCNKERYSDRYYAGLLFTETNARAKEHLSQFITATKTNQ